MKRRTPIHIHCWRPAKQNTKFKHQVCVYCDEIKVTQR